MAKRPMTDSEMRLLVKSAKKVLKKRKHRVLGGANTAGSASNATQRSAQSSASRPAGGGGGGGGGPRGPAGPSNSQPRSSPAGGSPGAVSRSVSPSQASRNVSEARTGAQHMGSYSPTVGRIAGPIQNFVANRLGTRVAPSQQDSVLGRIDRALSDRFGTPGPNSAYARSMQGGGGGGQRASGMRPAGLFPQQPLGQTSAAPAPQAMPALPEYVNYQAMPGMHMFNPQASQSLFDFMGRQYASGGKVGTSADAAMRLARLLLLRA